MNLLRFWPLALIAVFVLLCANPSAAQQRRVALVIGNADYKRSPLANPMNDARAMAAALRKLGFDVVEKLNLNQSSMKRAIWDFGERLRKGGVGLFYYAGHGVQVNGENYLIPLNARISREQDVEVEAVRVTRVMVEMEKANNGMNLVILDACRNNPFARSFRSSGRGLALMDAPVGTLVAYATAPGSVADDGDGKNGLYTGELLRAINKRGRGVTEVFMDVRRNVRKKSNGLQVPWESTSLEGQFYFIAPNAKITVNTAPRKPDASASENLYWTTIRDSSDPKDYELFLKQFPNGTFAALARHRLQRLKKKKTAAITPTPTKPSKPPVAYIHNPDRPRIKSSKVNPSALPIKANRNAVLVKAQQAMSRRDYKTAIGLFKNAAANGSAEAQDSLGDMYRKGVGVPRNDRTALEWYLRAAARGFAKSQYNVGQMYQYALPVPRNRDMVAKNPKRAMAWFRKAASQGYAPALGEVGTMYARGEGVSKDYAVAMEWFRQAAARNDPAGQYGLGMLYRYGLGVKKDYAKALDWFRKAARQGLPGPQCQLGKMYELGLGVARNQAEAKRLYGQAISKSKFSGYCFFLVSSGPKF